jgi:hypothetical protein
MLFDILEKENHTSRIIKRLFDILEKESQSSRIIKWLFDVLEEENQILRDRKCFLISWKRKIRLRQIENVF